MSLQEDPETTPSSPIGGMSLHRYAKGLGYFSAALCGLLIVATVGTTLWGLSLRDDDAAGAMSVGVTFLFLIPAAAIPVAMVCLAGMVSSLWALGTCTSPEARTGLRLSVVGPIVVVVSYAGCLALMMAAGV